MTSFEKAVPAKQGVFSYVLLKAIWLICGQLFIIKNFSLLRTLFLCCVCFELS